MTDKQMNLFMKKADREPKITVPASIEQVQVHALAPMHRNGAGNVSFRETCAGPMLGII